MPARQAFVIDRAKASRRVGVAETLNSHWPGTSLAEHVRECRPVPVISRFHPHPCPFSEGSPSGRPDHQGSATLGPDRHQIMASEFACYHDGFMTVVGRITCLGLVTVHKLDITRGRLFDGTRAAGRHLASGESAVNPIEPPCGKRVGDTAHRRRRQRHHIGIAPQE